MIGYYLSVVVIMYFIYMIVFPKLIGFSINKFKIFYSDIGFCLNKKSIVLSILLLIAMFTGFIIRKTPLFLQNPGSWLYTIQPPLVEELLFRGIIPYVLLKSFDKKIAFIISLFLFSGIHILNGFMGITISLLWGILFLMITTQIKSIFPAIILHYVVNSYNIFSWLFCFIIIFIYEVVFIIRRKIQ